MKLFRLKSFGRILFILTSNSPAICVVVVKEGKCAIATGQVKLSQKSTKKGKMSIKSRDLTVHKNYMETFIRFWYW